MNTPTLAVTTPAPLPFIFFAHTEKTGDTSPNGILRSYHGIHYAHVRALLHASPPAKRAIHADNLKWYAPCLHCVTDHAVHWG